MTMAAKLEEIRLDEDERSELEQVASLPTVRCSGRS